MESGKPSQPPAGRRSVEVTALIAILVISFFLNTWNNDFPASYHGDEGKKVTFVADNVQDFHHPILMLRVARNVTGLFRVTDLDQILRVGRITTAAFGTGIVLLLFVLARPFLSARYALWATFALAVSPILVIHSHYLKEDVLFTFTAYLSLWSFFRFVRKPTWLRTLLWGLCTGLAFSAQYKGILLLLVYVIGLLLPGVDRKRRLFLLLIAAVAASAVVFLTVNGPLFTDYSIFAKGVSSELRHIATGHRLRIHPVDHLFSFHLLRSVVPGMTPYTAIPAALSLVYFVVKKTTLQWEETAWLVFVVVFYFAVELTPMKAHPDHMRYVIPVVPGLVYFLFKGCEHAADRSHSTLLRTATVGCVAAAILVPLNVSLKLGYYLNRDTRATATDYVASTGRKALFEQYAGNTGQGLMVKHNFWQLQNDQFCYLVVSSFNYGRYAYGTTLRNQPKRVDEFNEAYQALFTLPYVEIQPVYRSFAFSNPTIRIVDITGVPRH